MHARWYGQAAFRLESREDAKTVLLDPFRVPRAEMEARGLRFDYPAIADVPADLVLITHEHFDHNGVEAASGSPQIIRQAAGTFDTPIGPVLGIAADHDPRAGTQRGMNAIYVLTLDGLRIAHFGDYGQTSLRTEQETALGRLDLLFLPVGGGPTIGTEGALEVVRRLRPRFVVPMHYRTDAVSFLEPADDFLAAFRHAVRLETPEFDTEALPRQGGGEAIAVIPAAPR